MSSPAIATNSLSLLFSSGPEKVVALEDVTVSFSYGEFTAIMGASGSGKTTLLNVIAGLETPDAGAALVDGTDIVGLNDDARADHRLNQIGLVFQDDNLLPMLDARENVALPLRARGWTPGDSVAEADRWLARVGLPGLEERRPSEMSGGQRQRVGIARAVAGDRRILLADEPTGALDSATTREVLALLRGLAEDGVCVVVVSHDSVVRDYADVTCLMRDGRLVSTERASA